MSEELAPEWRDITSYSQSEPRADRVPRAWLWELSWLRVRVHRIHQCDGWYLTCEPMARDKFLVSPRPDDAKLEALRIVRLWVQSMVPPLNAAVRTLMHKTEEQNDE